MTGLLQGKRAVISGVANPKSIAWGIAQAFHQHGAQLAFTCVDSARRRVEKLAAQVDSKLVFSCNVNRDEDIARAFQDVGQAFAGKLDIFVHSIAYANIDALGGEFLSVRREDWRVALETSAYSLVAMARARGRCWWPPGAGRS